VFCYSVFRFCCVLIVVNLVYLALDIQTCKFVLLLWTFLV